MAYDCASVYGRPKDARLATLGLKPASPCACRVAATGVVVAGGRTRLFLIRPRASYRLALEPGTPAAAKPKLASALGMHNYYQVPKAGWCVFYALLTLPHLTLIKACKAHVITLISCNLREIRCREVR